MKTYKSESLRIRSFETKKINKKSVTIVRTKVSGRTKPPEQEPQKGSSQTERFALLPGQEANHAVEEGK